jgi:hypothetical protein
LEQREASLHEQNAAIDTAATGTVDGHAAVRLAYEVAGLNGAALVHDTEYDILTGGADHVTVIIASDTPNPDPLLTWITSTIEVRTP